MGLDSAIARFRERQGALFRDECSVARAGSEGTFNEESGEYEDATATVIYQGSCQLRPAGGLVGTDALVGEREVRLKDFILKLPADTPVLENDIVTATASEYDADLVGRSFRITDVLRDGRQIARTCVVEEVT